MFLLAGGESGICYDFVFYTGKASKTEYGFCTNIVLELSETIPRLMNHKLFFDNYFTTIRLLVELKKLGILSVGTVRSNRLPDLAMKTSKDLAREGRGAMDHRIAEVDGVELCATRWHDNNVVNCLSTLHGYEPVDSVQRWSASDKQHIQVRRPAVIKAYNQYMGGVDLIDMLISLYRINVPSECTHLASTQRVLTLENAARTHEYSGFLSTQWWYSSYHLSIRVPQSSTHHRIFDTTHEYSVQFLSTLLVLVEYS